ncbi:hypothetical protein HDE69_004787 [Pedobacter cryoconitis]|uniref:Uncharacterized protein n=1 Tax=Pedobacter cryoconitis TaxID=188932 RepID=A0A7W8YY65_9SPHI|nr:hypothetical protein [Pedobacter cryoconitis]MBB5623700.1 hypothetical protein [Pedobacter cryoconitis]MBB5646116.1 hypothetical protein [Pedobacter cryoconitis]
MKNRSQFILILSTVIKSPFDLNRIKCTIANFKSVIEWSQDLDDVDKILRIVSHEDISEKLVLNLERAKVRAIIMQVFEKSIS